MEILVDFPGGQRVDAHYRGLDVQTNQDGTDPAPFELFLVSLATCAGFYVLSFCQQRGLPTEGIGVIQRTIRNPITRHLDQIDIEIQVPESFPAQYRDALVKSANTCAVKKAIENPPKFNTFTRVTAANLG